MSRKLVLCVDDRAASLEVRRLILEREGYEVLTAGDGAAGLELFTARSVDLVVLDYHMPELNGALLAQKMRALKPEVPVIMLSAYFEAPADAAGFIDAYVTKGQNPRVLLDQITQLIKGRSATSGHPG
ncbi:MAG TPA: response regulator [Terriglobales bacterium]|nr:response regulator [Terriglobales bacterium]